MNFYFIFEYINDIIINIFRDSYFNNESCLQGRSAAQHDPMESAGPATRAVHLKDWPVGRIFSCLHDHEIVWAAKAPLCKGSWLGVSRD